MKHHHSGLFIFGALLIVVQLLSIFGNIKAGLDLPLINSFYVLGYYLSYFCFGIIGLVCIVVSIFRSLTFELETPKEKVTPEKSIADHPQEAAAQPQEIVEEAQDKGKQKGIIHYIPAFILVAVFITICILFAVSQSQKYPTSTPRAIASSGIEATTTQSPSVERPKKSASPSPGYKTVSFGNVSVEVPEQYEVDESPYIGNGVITEINITDIFTTETGERKVFVSLISVEENIDHVNYNDKNQWESILHDLKIVYPKEEFTIIEEFGGYALFYKKAGGYAIDITDVTYTFCDDGYMYTITINYDQRYEKDAKHLIDSLAFSPSH